MGCYEERQWLSDGASGLPRRERRGGTFRTYCPDLLANRAFDLRGDVAADVSDAEESIRRLDATASSLTDTEALARILLRAESVASSHIEGLTLSPRRLLRAEAARAMGEPASDLTAEEVLGNIDAMRAAIEAAESDRRVTVETILAIHRCLLKDTRLHDHAGRLRDRQNWIGGNDYNPLAAAYVPPPADQVPDLVSDLAEFCNSDMLPAVVQAAIVHAQFETIHPFADGNGRTGRALIHLVLARRGLTRCVQPPISLSLAAMPRDYVTGLTGFRFDGAPNTPAAMQGANEWISIFAGACLRAVSRAEAFEDRCATIQREWRRILGPVRAKSSVDLLLRALPGSPVLSVKTAVAQLGRSKPQVNAAVGRLAEAGILKPLTVGRRNRAFEARDIIDAFATLEEQLRSGE